jgi:hypothetical protein
MINHKLNFLGSFAMRTGEECDVTLFGGWLQAGIS